MNQQKFEIVDIYWNDRVSVRFDKASKSYSVSVPQGLEAAGGIYQIYGHHPIYGTDVLLYIGKANDFAARLKQHFDGRFWNYVNLSCSFGIVHSSNKPTVDEEVLLPVSGVHDVSAPAATVSGSASHRRSPYLQCPACL